MFDTDKYYFTYFFKLPRLSYFFHYNICQMRKLAKIQIEEELRKFNLNWNKWNKVEYNEKK